MTATLSVNEKGQWILPKRIFQQAHLRPGSKVRVAHVEAGVLLTPVETSLEAELREIERATGLPRGKEPKNAMQIVKKAIAQVRQGR